MIKLINFNGNIYTYNKLLLIKIFKILEMLSLRKIIYFNKNEIFQYYNISCFI